MSKKSYYDILGVAKNASPKEIEKAYERLSFEHHPDAQADKTETEKKAAEERLKEINEAHDVLKDSEKRQNYDRYGSAENFARGSSGEKFDHEDPFFGFNEMFKDIFGGGMDFRQKTTTARSNYPAQDGEDISVG